MKVWTVEYCLRNEYDLIEGVFLSEAGAVAYIESKIEEHGMRLAEIGDDYKEWRNHYGDKTYLMTELEAKP